MSVESWDDQRPPVVDWGGTARRLLRVLAAVGVVVVATWLVLGLRAGELGLGALAELIGIGLLVSFVLETVIVGGSALRGLLAAGARGDRLASRDVSLLPPPLKRGRRAWAERPDPQGESRDT